MRTAIAVLSMSLLALACSDPSGPGEPGIDFTLESSAAVVDTKSRVEIRVTVTRAVGVQFPLTVRFEKANAGEEFRPEGLFFLVGPEERTAVIRPALRQDPRIRATVSDASPQMLSATRTITIDVIDFP